MTIDPRAGKLPDPSMLTDLPQLVSAYYTGLPDPFDPAQRIAFGTSGHRGSSLSLAFNERHILAVTQAICLYRLAQGIDGPLFLGMDSHALSTPAHATALEVLAANGVEVMIASNSDYTPTPAISHAILTHNAGREHGLADGIVITPSHNPPTDGGFKYNPPHGGPAGSEITDWIEKTGNKLLEADLAGVSRIPLGRALKASTTHRHDYIARYVGDLANVIDMAAIKSSGLPLGVDPLGGAGVHYWQPIADRYGLDLTVLNPFVDPTFRFMTVDWDGQIRMDPSSPYAMRSLIDLKDRFEVAFACDTDHDRHGIVTKSTGLLPPNHYLSAAISYLLKHRPGWSEAAGIGKTLVSSQMIDRVTKAAGRKLVEVPVGFKWFVDGLVSGSLCFGGEESAGASFSRLDGSAWSTDKDGIILGLLAAEMTAKLGRNPGELYRDLEREFGQSHYVRTDAPADAALKSALKKLTPAEIRTTELAGEKIEAILTKAPGNGAAIGGLKVAARNGWFAVRPSGTEEIYKIYAESFLGEAHLARIVEEAQAIVKSAIGR